MRWVSGRLAAAPWVLAAAAAELTVSSQFLSLDDLPDTRANVDLRNEQGSGVSALPIGGVERSS